MGRRVTLFIIQNFIFVYFLLHKTSSTETSAYSEPYSNSTTFNSPTINNPNNLTSSNDDSSFLSAMQKLIFGNESKNFFKNLSNSKLPGLALAAAESAVSAAQHGSAPYLLGGGEPPALIPDNTHHYHYQGVSPNVPAYGSYPTQYLGGSTAASPCTLPQQIGTGPYRIPRWHYNPARTRCELFYWSGCCGNANNFQTHQECEQQCEQAGSSQKPNTVVYVPFTLTFTMRPTGSPGPVGGPSIIAGPAGEISGPLVPNPNSAGISNEITSSGNIQEGSWLSPSNSLNELTSTQYKPEPLAERSYPGPSVQPSPASLLPAKAVCEQDLDSGHGASDHTRYYFNPNTKLCEEFQFRGNGGNLNNFLDLEECQRSCRESPNPCAYGTVPQPVQCQPGSVMSSTCTGQQFCHVGATPTTTICCNKPAIIDPCIQPLNIGIGNANLQRFYYNPPAQQCQSYVYKGLQGNENNFLTQIDCENVCQVNPCSRGTPYRSTMGTLFCSSLSVCPAGYFCHIGANTKTSVCCQALGGDPCGQPMDQGQGTAQLARWYWSQQLQCCQPFLYFGEKGTQNNFLSKEDCERFCYVEVNPCKLPIQMPLVQCVPGPDTCGGRRDLWCHIGATQQTTVCCPAEAINRCSQPMEQGVGNAKLERWFYNPQMGQCQPFSYAGLKGNQNNFMTRDECEFSCLPNPCPSGRPALNSDGRAQSCAVSSSLSTCPMNHWCHIGVDTTTTVCCPDASPNPCQLPMSSGEGSANLERFHYDQATKTCKPFTYKGLKGNQNNYLSLRACQLACQPLDNPCIGQPATSSSGQVLFCSSTNKDTCPVNFWCHLGANPETTVCCPGATNPCSVPLAPGTGNAGLARWYYNPDDRECVSFQYNGKRGNQNNFLSQTECQRTCPEQLCLLSIDRGACSGRQTRYAFNRQTGQCVAFEYTGCGGNLNNFLTMADCTSTCGAVGF